MAKCASYIEERGWRDSCLGQVLYITITRHDEKRMTWEQVHRRFADAYPGRWAVEVFPPDECLVNEINRYHLFVLDEPPRGLTINR